jgi:NAD(P)-dependent dehydrogenase (short-subunit alcohol dehydrogenase family)
VSVVIASVKRAFSACISTGLQTQAQLPTMPWPAHCNIPLVITTAIAGLLLSSWAVVTAFPSPHSLEWVEAAARDCLRGRTAIVTGATRGIGREVAQMLASVSGAHTILACRDMAACHRTVQEMRKSSPGVSVECAELDLARLESVEAFAAQLTGGSKKGATARPVDLLVHNAGVMAVEDRRTEDGFETTFQVNHLAPFLLQLLLIPSLRAASASRSHAPHASGPLSRAERHRLEGWGGDVRVVWVSSGAHKWGGIPDGPGEGTRGEQEAEEDCGRVTGIFGACWGGLREGSGAGGWGLRVWGYLFGNLSWYVLWLRVSGWGLGIGGGG